MKNCMEPYILDLRSEGCPMALLLAKRASKKEGAHGFKIYISDKSSMLDILRFLEKNHFSVHVEDDKKHHILTIIKMSTCSDV